MDQSQASSFLSRNQALLVNGWEYPCGQSLEGRSNNQPVSHLNKLQPILILGVDEYCIICVHLEMLIKM